ncbi:serine/threonine-protein kinase [Marinagarivorans algicola]|uniref:serine/threonine-protein kinase n=1 Tax=Marinagarivorans algicola TaxID=1513270 RepID=UPI0006B95B35|nr:serine/threonine-protein kinase [Marinagarivorans algicola]
MTVKIPGYTISKTLGKGGMATVYLAVQEIFERKVALKIMSRALNEDPAFGQRFMREAQIVSKLIHPNIVTVYDVGLFEGSYYLSMEYIDGEDLKHCRKQLTFQEKIRAVKDIASALDTSGAKGYVHRDIKPENIMIEAATKRAVLMDFGIARASEADISVTQAGTAIGTPHYMSPEQAKGLDVDPRADLYSLGVVLFYLTAGYVPFEGDSAVAIGIRHITEAIPELPAYLREMQWLIDKSMAKDPDDRFQSGAEFIAALDELDVTLLADNMHRESDHSEPVDFDTPTLVGEQPLHQYGDGIHEEEPENFTLSFHSQEPPTIVDIKWPMYAAGACVTLLVSIGLYLVSTYEPSSIEAQSSLGQPQNLQSSRSNLKADKPLSAEQQQALRSIQQRITHAKSSYHNEKSEHHLTQLVELYRQVLSIEPNNSDTQYILNALADEQINRIMPLFNQGKFKEAQRQLALVVSLFPRYTTAMLNNIRSQMTLRSQIESLQQKAQQYWIRKQLVEPNEHNAAANYQAILAIAPEFKPAHDGLSRIAQSLTQSARNALDAQDIKNARRFMYLALSVLPFYQPALNLEAQLFNQSAHAEKIQALLKKAERYQQHGAIYSPKAQNAYAVLSRLLILDPDNTSAVQQRNQLSAVFKAHLLSLIQQGHYGQAQRAASEAQQEHSRDKAIQTVAHDIEQIIQEHQTANRPKIINIRASGAPKPRLDRKQPRSIAVADKLFFRFEYLNFAPEQMQLHAQLIDETNNLTLGHKVLFITGPKGEYEFLLDLSRAGIKAGRYRIDIHKTHSSPALGSLHFKVS